MPFVHIQTVKGLLKDKEKQELLDRITELMVTYEGKGNPEFKKLVWIRIDETDPINWSLGGIQLTSKAIAKYLSFK